MLQALKRALSLCGLVEVVLHEQGSERHRDRVVLLDEASVVASEAKERLHRVQHLGYGLVQYGLHLLWIHGDLGLRDNVAQIGHRAGAEQTLGALDEQLVFL
jgi:hypothetical protein